MACSAFSPVISVPSPFISYRSVSWMRLIRSSDSTTISFSSTEQPFSSYARTVPGLRYGSHQRRVSCRQAAAYFFSRLAGSSGYSFSPLITVIVTGRSSAPRIASLSSDRVYSACSVKSTRQPNRSVSSTAAKPDRAKRSAIRPIERIRLPCFMVLSYPSRRIFKTSQQMPRHSAVRLTKYTNVEQSNTPEASL